VWIYFLSLNPSSHSATQFIEPGLTTFCMAPQYPERKPFSVSSTSTLAREQLTQIEVLGLNHMSIVDVFGILCAAVHQMAVSVQTVCPINLIWD